MTAIIDCDKRHSLVLQYGTSKIKLYYIAALNEAYHSVLLQCIEELRCYTAITKAASRLRHLVNAGIGASELVFQ